MQFARMPIRLRTTIIRTSFNIEIDSDLHQALEKIAACEDRTVSQMTEEAIRSLVGRWVAKRDAIEAALKEAEKGVFISEEAVQRWMDSWETENELPMPEADIFPAGHKCHNT